MGKALLSNLNHDIMEEINKIIREQLITANEKRIKAIQGFWWSVGVLAIMCIVLL
jgi:hypothetical protein